MIATSTPSASSEYRRWRASGASAISGGWRAASSRSACAGVAWWWWRGPGRGRGGRGRRVDAGLQPRDEAAGVAERAAGCAAGDAVVVDRGEVAGRDLGDLVDGRVPAEHSARHALVDDHP